MRFRGLFLAILLLALPVRGETVGLSSAVVQADDLLPVLQDLLPTDAALWRLRDAIRHYRDVEANGGWPSVPPGPKLELGAQDSRVALPRRRLSVTGDLPVAGTLPDSFDAAVDAAVRRFRGRHGLEVDGVVGVNTLAALNVPVTERLTTMELNLRRIEREYREWGKRYVVVNTAAASYRLVDHGRQIFERAAIVGRRGWPTPRLDSVIDRLEFNPYWVVPPRIARLEVLPMFQGDPDYMLHNDMHWVNGQIRQDPGPKDPLGKVKFLFLNPYDVYLHDTNSPQRFERWDRFRSHGCMRIARALDLAAYLLKDELAWPTQRVQEVVESGRTVQVRLPAPISLHVVYDTAWVDEAGIVSFRSDIWRRLPRLLRTGSGDVRPKGDTDGRMEMTFRLTSTAFLDGQRIPKRHSCEGEDLSPPLAWSGAPPATRGFLLLCDDPDAPGGTWRHWCIFNMPATATELEEGIARNAQVGAMWQAVNDFGEIGYRGPCPPRGHGTHHYHFRLLALDTEQLAVKEQAMCKEVAAAARSHAIGTAELVGTYAR